MNPLPSPSVSALRCSSARIALAVGLLASSLAQGQTAPNSAAQPAATPAPTIAPILAENKDKLSYATGVQAVRNFTKNGIPFNVDEIIRGMRDAMAGGDLAMSEREIRLVLNALQTDLRRNMAANQKALSEKNTQRGEAFQAAFKAKPGVKDLGNGVLYRVVQQGSGPKPSEAEAVIVKYRGTNIEGVEFDATEDGKTAILRVNQVIMGWREALKQMPTGAKWELVIPPKLAYGERGVGTTIGPNETLVFEVELVGIKNP